MPPQSEIDWDAVQLAYRAGDIPINELARRFDIPASTLRSRARRSFWPRAGKATPATQSPPTPEAIDLARRRALLRRMTSAIGKIITRMEQRMNSDAADGAPAPTASDQERDSRLIHSLIRSLAKVTEFEADLDRAADGPDGSAKSHDARDLADEADRFRREIADRLARLGTPPRD